MVKNGEVIRAQLEAHLEKLERLREQAKSGTAARELQDTIRLVRRQLGKDLETK